MGRLKSSICDSNFVSGNNLPATSWLATSRNALSLGAEVSTGKAEVELCSGKGSIVSTDRPSVIALTSSLISGFNSKI